MEQKRITDLINYLKSIEEQEGDLDLSTGFGEGVYDLEDYIRIDYENDCIEIN